MTTDSSVGQLLTESFIGAINWRAMNENVRRLQACIVKAT